VSLTLVVSCPFCGTDADTLPRAIATFNAWYELGGENRAAQSARANNRALLRMQCGEHSDEFAGDPFPDDETEDVL